MDQKQKQIEEMARDIDGSRWRAEQDYTGCHLNSSEIAEHLYEAGWRKQDEVFTLFDKIFALCDNADQKLDILFPPNDEYRKGYANSVKHFRENMEKLKKKYTEGGESDA